MSDTVPRAFAGECIPIVMSTDEGYIPPLCVALSSLVRHASPTLRYDIIILCLGRGYEILNPLLPAFRRENISVRAVELGQISTFHTSSHISLASYNRLYIPDLMPEYDKVLYLDCDITVHADVAGLYNLDLGHNYLAACEDYYLTQGSSPYVPEALAVLQEQGCPVEGHINAGILVMNLVAMRRDNMQQRMLECAAAQDHYYHDQCVLNITCQGRILPLPLEWNMCVAESLGRDALSAWHHTSLHHLLNSSGYKIMHFISCKKPWRHLRRPLADLWWKEACRVPYAVVAGLFHTSIAKWLALKLLASCFPGKIGQAAAHRLFPAFTWKP